MMAIFGIEGGIGSGKTMTLVYYALRDLKEGKRIFSNVKFKNLSADEKSRITYLTKDAINNMFNEIKSGRFDMKNSTVIIQEAHNYVDSRTSMTDKNRVFSYWILQSRHTGAGSCDIMYDTQELGQVDKRLRNNTDFIMRPQIYTKLENGMPVDVSVLIEAKIGQRWCKFTEMYNGLEVIKFYDTHEIVEY